MHPLFHLIATRPQLLAEHAEAYAELVSVEAPRISAAFRRSAWLLALAFGSLGAGVVLAGVAVMLWATAPEAQIRLPWTLVAVPALPLLAGLLCVLAARRGREREAFDTLRQQVRADIALLRETALA
jgi:uncharacterized membrane protein YqjE